MMSPPLAGRRVVTTRDRPGRLDSTLASLGADVINVPLIAIETPLDGGAALRGALASVAEFDWVVVTSRHGAMRVGPALAAHPDVRLAAVGAATAEVLARLAGRAVDVVPERQTATDLAEAFAGGAGNVLLAQADRADPTLSERLTGHGFRIETVTAYRTVLRTPTERERTAALESDAVAFASGSAAESWAETIGPSTPPVVAAIGPVTEAAAKRYGLKVTHVATDHHVEGLVAVMLAALTSTAVESRRPRP